MTKMSGNFYLASRAFSTALMRFRTRRYDIATETAKTAAAAA